MNHYYHILLKNVPQLLSYQSEISIETGSLVRVSLGKRRVHGLIIEEITKPDHDCVLIEKILLSEAMSPLQIQLCQWMSGYYFASLSKCLQLFVPSIIWNNTLQVKRDITYQLSVDINSAIVQCKNAKKQQAFLKICAEKESINEQEAKNICSQSIIKKLLEKNLIIKIEGELLNPDKHHRSKPYHEQPLTDEQQKALNIILHEKFCSDIKEQKNKRREDWSLVTGHWSFLLHGVTGSGKTEIYLQIIKEQILQGKQNLLLVPEIALTTELIQYFTEHFPDQISIIHSKLSDRERIQAWHRIHQGKTQLILGSRSALFTPWKNLGVIIIDEEHEWTYKQESSPRYHIRTVAKKLCELSSPCPLLLLGSATPSLESFFEAHQAERPTRLLQMKNRATEHSLPKVHVIDLREEYQKKNFTMFSDLLREKIHDRLEKREQIILFLNKRGSSSSITCRDCGYTPKCEDCDISLTYHSKLRDFRNGGLICHYCGSFRDNPLKCPHCQSVAIKYFGTGTQKAEEQLSELFPSARILRADKDTTGGKYDFEEIYHRMRREEADILIGTQMIAKGLDLPKITLTGILLADIGLHIPDFRASERVFQLLTQVAGRSGRHLPGEVIIQSYQPEHPSIQAAKTHDYEQFYEQEITHRKILNYSPFCKSIKLTFAHENPKIAEEEAIKLYGELNDNSLINGKPDKNALTIGISPHYIPKLHGKYLWNILIRGNEPREILQSINFPKGWKIDVDPQ